MKFGYHYTYVNQSVIDDVTGESYVPLSFSDTSVETSETSVYIYYDIETHKERVYDYAINQYVTSYTKFMTTALGERVNSVDNLYFGEISNFEYLKVELPDSTKLTDLNTDYINQM
ncbi:MAG: hypothetical protein IKD08_03905, partial [Alphaproteobacteria bacterium]|nr:hypothetical protein [Alphaproteobacteria bacterium]